MTRDEAIQKAIKLLSLATSSNANEAALAASMAQQILDKYEISQEMLEGSDQEEPEDFRDFGDDDDPLEEAGRVPIWKMRLAQALCNANACFMYRAQKFVDFGMSRHKTKTCFQVVGRPSDVQKIRYLYSYLKKEVERLTKEQGPGHGRNWCNNFKVGVVDTIQRKLREAWHEAASTMRQENENNPHALVKIDKALEKIKKRSMDVEVFANNKHKFHKVKTNGGQLNYGAREMGRKAGEQIRIGNARGSLGAGTRQITP